MKSKINNWYGHPLMMGKPGWPEHPHYYKVVSAIMPRCEDKDKMFAQFVCEDDTKRFIKLWNGTRHLTNFEIDEILMRYKPKE